MGRNSASGISVQGGQKRAKGLPMQDPEFWQPSAEFRGGRPRVIVDRKLEDYPAPTPQDTPCVLWQGPVDRYGYGVLSGRGKGTSANHHKRVRAHRWVWEQANCIDIPAGIVVRHLCDNRVCINLEHLELGTQADNVRDAAARNHLGPVRVLTPSQVAEIVRRRAAGEVWSSIHKDFSHVSLSAVRRALFYAGDT